MLDRKVLVSFARVTCANRWYKNNLEISYYSKEGKQGNLDCKLLMSKAHSAWSIEVLFHNMKDKNRLSMCQSLEQKQSNLDEDGNSSIPFSF